MAKLSMISTRRLTAERPYEIEKQISVSPASVTNILTKFAEAMPPLQELNNARNGDEAFI
jgi:hypothetical protein